jgi:putative FmdB family regulatory protein
MPLYEYYCKTCAAPFEALRSMSQADSPANCPRCKQASAQRLISLFAAHARDSGGGSRVVAGGGACGSCAGGHCSTCSH